MSIVRKLSVAVLAVAALAFGANVASAFHHHHHHHHFHHR